LTYRSHDPFTSVNGTVPDDGLMGVRAVAAPKVNTLDRATLERLAGDEDLRIVGESGVDVLEVLEVLLKRVVRVEELEVGQRSGTVLALDGTWARGVSIEH
jgi:hypothetical protein